MPRASPTVWDLPRNDLQACHRYWLAHPDLTVDEWTAMLRLQDDPAALIRAAKGWSRARDRTARS